MPQGIPPLTPTPYDDYLPPLPLVTLSQSAIQTFLLVVEAALCGQLDVILDNMTDEIARAQIQDELDAALSIYFRDETLTEAACDIVPVDYADVLEAAAREQAYTDHLLAHIGGARRIKVNSRKRSIAYNLAQSQE